MSIIQLTYAHFICLIKSEALQNVPLTTSRPTCKLPREKPQITLLQKQFFPCRHHQTADGNCCLCRELSTMHPKLETPNIATSVFSNSEQK